MAYAGVEFENDGGISLLHSTWLTPLKKVVFWPPKQTKKNFVKLLQCEHQDPPEDGSWKLHKIKRIFFQADNYDTAERKIKIAEDTSNLETDDASEESLLLTRKRQIRPPSTYSSDELSDSENGIRRKKQKNKRELPRPPLLNPCSRATEPLQSCDSPVSQHRGSPLSRGSSLYTPSPVASYHSQREFLVENNRDLGETSDERMTQSQDIRRPRTTSLITNDFV